MTARGAEPAGLGQALPAPSAADRVDHLARELRQHRADIDVQVEKFRQARAELAARQQSYRELYDRAPVGYLTLDDDGRICRVNRAAACFLGLEAQELLGLPFTDLLPYRDAENFRGAILDLAATRPSPSLVVSFLCPSDAPRRAKLSLSRTSAGLFVSIQGLVAERAVNFALQEREAELRAVWETVSDGIALVNERNEMVSLNLALTRLFGRSRERLLGRRITEFIPLFPTIPPGRRLELWAYGESGRAVPVDVSVTLREGPRRMLVAVIVDVTERRQERAERDEALRRFGEIAAHVEDAFYVAEAGSGESLYVSPAFETIYGRPLAEHTQQAWPRLDWVHLEDRFLVTQAVEAAHDGVPFELEYRIVRPDGAVRVIHDRATVVTGSHRITGILRDVTAERELAQNLRKAQRLEAMGTLASGVAHDFNNLLMGVGGCVQLALGRLDPADPASAYLRRAADSILRGATLTKQILRIGDTRRLAGGQVVLDDVLAGARDLVESLVGETIAVRIAGDAPDVRVVAEAGDIEQILVNLATNARDAMPGGGELWLATTLADETVTLSVRDTGSGMSPAVRSRVFEPFFTTKRAGKGTGLGLATVFALARRLGGDVELDSVEGKGTTVTVVLPIAKRASQLPAPPSSAPHAGGETVLLVDDDPLVRLTVENHLEALGYRALVASNAEEAIGICEDDSFVIDLMISDVMMPGMLGPELARALAARNKRFPVLYMSAHSRDELLRDGRIDESARLLPKPFDADELGRALASALEEARHVPVGSRRRTLVIDDDPDIAEGLKEILEFEEFEVAVANDPQTALSVASEFEPDVVLCDLELGSEMSGYELVDALRSRPGLARTYFVALTGHEPNSCREHAHKSGFSRVLGKPLDVAKLRYALSHAQ